MASKILSQVPVSIRCEKCGKQLYQITIPTETKGSIVFSGGSIDNKCPRCGSYYRMGLSDLVSYVYKHQDKAHPAVPFIDGKADGNFNVHRKITFGDGKGPSWIRLDSGKSKLNVTDGED